MRGIDVKLYMHLNVLQLEAAALNFTNIITFICDR